MSTEEDMRHVEMLLQQSGSNLGTPHRVAAGGGGGGAPTIDYSSGGGGYGGQPQEDLVSPGMIDPLGGYGGYDLTGGNNHQQPHPQFDMSPVPGEDYQGAGYGEAVEYQGGGADGVDGADPNSVVNTSGDSPYIPGYDRMQRWVKRKEQRMIDLEKAKAQKYEEECPFQPATYTPTRSLTSYDRAYGFDGAVDRVREGRRRKQEKKEYEQKFWANESRWTGETTVPEPFELTDERNRRMKISSLKKTYDQVAHAVRHQHGHDPSEIEPTSVPSGLFSCKTSQSIMELSPDRYQGRSRFASGSIQGRTQSQQQQQQQLAIEQQYSHRSLGGDGASNLVATPGRFTAGDATPGSAAGGVIVISADERRARAQQQATSGNRTPHTSRSMGGYSPPSSHRSKFGVSPKALTPHSQLPL